MKKSRILAFALVVAIMLVGAGYASWTDKLTITNTVSTGELNVKFTETTDISDNGLDNGIDYIASTIVPADPSGDVNSLTVTMPNMFPGAYVQFNTKLVNDGTIPAVVTQADIYSIETQNGLFGLNNDSLTAMTPAQQAKVNVTGTITHKRGTTAVSGHIITLSTNLKDFATQLNSMKAWRLEANDYVEFTNIKIEVPTTIGDGNGNQDEMENTYCKFKIELNFKQHNVQG